MEYKNLTKHEINIYNSDGELVTTIPPSGLEARIATESRLVDTVDGVEFYETFVNGDPYLQDEKGEKHTLPTLEVGTALIVSGMFRSNFDRADLYQPGRLLRNEKGQPIGCVGLSR